MLGQVSIAAATAVLDYDLFRDKLWRQSGRPRRIVAIGLAGSAAALDSKARLTIGAVEVGEIYNAATGAVLRDHMFRIGAHVPAGAEVHLYVTDAPTTNPLNASVDFKDE